MWSPLPRTTGQRSSSRGPAVLACFPSTPTNAFGWKRWDSPKVFLSTGLLPFIAARYSMLIGIFASQPPTARKYSSGIGSEVIINSGASFDGHVSMSQRVVFGEVYSSLTSRLRAAQAGASTLCCLSYVQIRLRSYIRIIIPAGGCSPPVVLALSGWGIASINVHLADASAAFTLSLRRYKALHPRLGRDLRPCPLVLIHRSA